MAQAFGLAHFERLIMKLKDHFTDFDINPISADPLHGPITQQLIEFLQQRNEEKLKASIEYLGDKWLLHPDNKAQRKGLQ
jgi:hypothetical protein